MTRNLKTLGLALVAVLALSAVAASGASAAPALFTAEVGAGEQAEIHGAQVGTDTFTVNGRALTCVTAKETGFPEEGGNPKLGPEATYVTLTPVYETCHVVIGGIITRTVTVTMNSCDYTFNATKGTNNTPFSADLTINCPDESKIEIHVYNTNNHNDAGAEVLCTYDVTHRTINDQIELTNIPGPPDDILSHINASLVVHNTVNLGPTCGENAIEPAVYKGTHTLQATNEAGQFVNTTVS